MQKTQRWWHTEMPHSISARFEGLEFHHVARDSNQAADILARMGAKRDPIPPNTFVERLFKPSVVWQDESGNPSPEPIIPPDAEHNSDIIGGSGTEMTPSAHVIMAVVAPLTEPLLAYLNRRELSDDQNEARRIV